MSSNDTKKLELLDCTLRDGAYIVDAHFGVAAIKGILKELALKYCRSRREESL